MEQIKLVAFTNVPLLPSAFLRQHRPVRIDSMRIESHTFVVRPRCRSLLLSFFESRSMIPPRITETLFLLSSVERTALRCDCALSGFREVIFKKKSETKLSQRNEAF